MLASPTARTFRRSEIDGACEALDEIEAGKQKVRAAFRDLLADHYITTATKETADWWLEVLEDTLTDSMAVAKTHHETLRGYYE